MSSATSKSILATRLENQTTLDWWIDTAGNGNFKAAPCETLRDPLRTVGREFSELGPSFLSKAGPQSRVAIPCTGAGGRRRRGGTLLDCGYRIRVKIAESDRQAERVLHGRMCVAEMFNNG